MSFHSQPVNRIISARRGGSQGRPELKRNLRPMFKRDHKGAVLPLVAFLLFVGFAFVGFSVDVMRSAYTSSCVRWGAEAAALGAYAQSLSSPGQSYSASAYQSNINAALNQAAAWNTAPYGPDTSSSGLASVESPVHFESSDITFVPNPNNADNDFFLQVRGRRDGSDSLLLYFLPLLYAFNGGGVQAQIPPGLTQAHPQRVVEVVAQPATRIGAGAPRNASDLRAQQLAGFAVLPIAISNAQFAAIAGGNGSSPTTYTVDICGSQAGAQSGHIAAALVNATPSGSSLNYYGDTGVLGISQLSKNLAYFAPIQSANEIPSAVVENGSVLPVFDVSSALFQQNQQSVLTQLNKLAVQRSYIFPVIASNPSFSSGASAAAANTTTGFARLRVLSWPAVASGNMSFVVQLEESVPLPNASSANDTRSVPDSFGQMPAPTAPFLPRTVTAEGGLTTRSRGIVMAPALSPRIPVVTN